jgi:hypothetical protein
MCTSDHLQIDLGRFGRQQLRPQRNMVQLKLGVKHGQEVVRIKRKENDANCT